MADDDSPVYKAIMGEPVPSPAPMPGSTVEEALDRLESILRENALLFSDDEAALATVRGEIERLTEERDEARAGVMIAAALPSSPAAVRAESAEAENARLNRYIDQYILDVERLSSLLESTREGLREAGRTPKEEKRDLPSVP